MPKLHYLSYFQPANTVAVNELGKKGYPIVLPEQYESLDKTLSASSGILSIAVGKGYKQIDIFNKLLTDLFFNTDIDPKKVAYVIYLDQEYRKLLEQGTSIPHLMQQKYNMKNASIFEIDQDCGGITLAIWLSDRLLTSAKEEQYTIIMSSTLMTQSSNRLSPTGLTFFGDGACLTVLSNSTEGLSIVDFISYFEPYANTQNSNKKPDLLWWPKVGTKLIKDIILKNSLTPNDIHTLIVQNIHQLLYSKIYPDLLGIPSKKFFLENIPKGGHQINVDIIRNLKDYLDKYTPPKDSYILLFCDYSDFHSYAGWNALLVKV